MINKAISSQYSFSNYISKERFMSYYYQLKFIYQINPKNILEIGCGNKFLESVLKKHFNYKTLDIDRNLKPDYLGSVTEMPLKNSSFDLICCFEVLEHLPFYEFEKSLKEIFRVSRKDVLISLPFSRIDLKFEIKLPFLKNKRIKIAIPKFYKKHKFDGQHYWEIGKKDYSFRKIKNIIKKYFIIEKIINPYENTYHIFLKMRKNKNVHI